MAGILKVDQVQSDSNLSFQVAGANVAYMNSTGLQMTGGQIIAGSNTLINSSGLIYANAGIAFPATQVASANANILDDYEEGTWTPVITGSSSVGSASYIAQNGTYVKIGTYVYFACDVQSSSTPTGTGILFITGLPYTSMNNQFSMSIGLPYWNGLARAFTAVGGYADGGTTRIVMMGTLGAATGITYMAPSDMPNASRLFFAGVYQTQN
jgi:hypothetical protein